MKKSLFSIVLVIAVITSGTAVSFAKINLEPAIFVSEEYRDNINLAAGDNKQEDYVTTIHPKIDLTYSPSKKLDLSLHYGLQFKFYKNQNDRDDSTIKDAQRIIFESHAKPFNHFFIDVTDLYNKVPIDTRLPNTDDNESENKTLRNVFSVTPYVEYPLTSTAFTRIGYAYNKISYDFVGGNDSEGHAAYATVSNKFPFKVTVGMNYLFYAYRPELSNEYDSHRGSFSILYNINADFFVFANFGKVFLDFSDGSNADSYFWKVGGEYINILAGIDVTITYDTLLTEPGFSSDNLTSLSPSTELWSIGTPYSYALGSALQGVSDSKRFNIYLTSRRFIEIKVNPYYKVDDYIESNRKDEIVGVEIDITKPVSDTVTIYAGGEWEEHDFSPGIKDIERYGLGCLVDYQLSKSIRIGIGYRHNERRSTSSDEYDTNRYWAEAEVSF